MRLKGFVKLRDDIHYNVRNIKSYEKCLDGYLITFVGETITLYVTDYEFDLIEEEFNKLYK
jgi:hypothetical protein